MVKVVKGQGKLKSLPQNGQPIGINNIEFIPLNDSQLQKEFFVMKNKCDGYFNTLYKELKRK